MYIDFDECIHYIGINYAIIEKHVNEDIKCEHGYTYYAGQRNI